MERPGATTLKGNPLTLIGPALKPGEKMTVEGWISRAGLMRALASCRTRATSAMSRSLGPNCSATVPSNSPMSSFCI